MILQHELHVSTWKRSLLWRRPHCSSLFSNLATLYAPQSINHFPKEEHFYWLCLNMWKYHLYFPSYTTASQCTVCYYRVTYPPLRPWIQEKQRFDSWVHKQVLFSAVLRSFTVIPYLVCEDNVVGVQMEFCLLMDGSESGWYEKEGIR